MLKYTDEEHGLTINEIRDKLLEYEISAERKSLYEDMKDLEVLGFSIESYSEGRNTKYHVVNKPFEIAETKLLVDAIQSSKFITERKSRQLIKKLMENVSDFEAAQLNRQVVVSGRIKAMNESIYYNVDEIHSAISHNKTIEFEYLKWDLNKKLVPRKEGKYEVSPWALTWDNENYYLVAYDSEAGKIKHYRVDKMRSISMTEKSREGRDIFEKFDMAAYTKESFGMYGGEETTVILRFKDHLVGVMIDRFGTDIPIHPSDREGFSETRVQVAVSEQFFGWIFGLGSDVEIVEPKDIRQNFKKTLDELKGGYDN